MPDDFLHLQCHLFHLPNLVLPFQQGQGEPKDCQRSDGQMDRAQVAGNPHQEGCQEVLEGMSDEMVHLRLLLLSEGQTGRIR